jgi:hypothetical protein
MFVLRAISILGTVLLLTLAFPLFSAYQKAEQACVEATMMQADAASTNDQSKRPEIEIKLADCQRKAHAAALIAEAVASVFNRKS